VGAVAELPFDAGGEEEHHPPQAGGGQVDVGQQRGAGAQTPADGYVGSE